MSHPRAWSPWGCLVGAVAVVAVSALSGCGAATTSPSAASGSASPGSSSCRDPDGCPDYAFYLSDFCEVQVIRDMLGDGRLAASDLPAWADLSKRDGMPLIIDFGRHQSVSPDRRLDQLDASVLTPHRLRISRSATRDCRDHATACEFYNNTRTG